MKKINFVDDCKYLGAIICSHKADDKDIDRQIRSTYTQGSVSKFRKCPDEVKSHLFKTYCYNLYNCQHWSAFTSKSMKRMKVAYNYVFRKLMAIKRRSSVSQEYVRRNLCGFNVLLRNCVWGSYKCTVGSKNRLVHKIISSSYFLCGSSICKRWKKLSLYYISLYAV